MPVQVMAFGGGLVGQRTASANTPWVVPIPPYVTPAGGYTSFTRLVAMSVTNGTTANPVYFMRPIGRTTTTAAASQGATALTLAADPGPAGNGIAGGDYVTVALSNGTFHTAIVSSWNADTKVLTLMAPLPANVLAGARVWDFGIYTDTDPVTGVAHPMFPVAASTTGVFSAAGGGFVGAVAGDPLLLFNPNATNASTHNFSEYVYTRE